MAVINRTRVQLINAVEMDGTPFEVTKTAVTTTAKYFDFAGKDDKTAIIIDNSANSSVTTVTVLAGTGLNAVADLELKVPASKVVAMRLDSASFKQMAGENKGSFGIKTASGTVQVSVIELP